MRATGEKLEEKYILPIFREMSKGLRAIHEAGIMHRDIKCKSQKSRTDTVRYSFGGSQEIC